MLKPRCNVVATSGYVFAKTLFYDPTLQENSASEHIMLLYDSLMKPD